MRRASLLVCAAVCALAGAARADVFSPGPLSKGHADLEGLTNCTRCHVAGGQLSEQRCVDCHKEIGRSIASKKGLHGHLADADRSCNKCHHEHQGRDFEIVDWGKNGKKGFDHRATGFPLAGKHAPLDCKACHTERRIADDAVRAAIAKQPGRQTWFGLSAQCSACHFDEHRGQLRTSCKDCHDERGWKSAPKFNHARTAYPLQGKHASVECLSCHAREKDPRFSRDAFPHPVSEVFSRFKPVAHASCTDCHKDPHANRFGQTCTNCHSVAGWLVLKAGESAGGARAFHENTRYPLRGAHAEAACRGCHGPFPGGSKPVYKGLAFDACTACHVDAHLGQLGRPGIAASACDRCHTVQGFTPVRYEARDHTRWPLSGAHEAVPCLLCHRADAALQTRTTVMRAWLEKRHRKELIVLTQFHPPGDNSRCDACHKDPHAGQFAARVRRAGCADCHQVSGWSNVRFDHDRETKFPLAGGHANRACASCHFAESGGTVRFASTSTACASCHADAHAGQFAIARGAPADCARCHSAASWAPATAFEHRPPFTAFLLQGKHAGVECARCHVEVAVAAGVRTRRYRGLPTACEGCHADEHRGAFREMARELAR